MNSNAEKIVSKFYNEGGWDAVDGISEDTRIFEDLRESAKEYVSKCRLRLFTHIPEKGENILDMASGPIPYPEYLEYSRNFNKRYCVDLSSVALQKAEEKISSHGVFLQGSFFDLKFDENFFDCCVSLHTIYHIDKELQEKAIRKLINITKHGRPVIVLYSNPKTLLSALKLPIVTLIKLARFLKLMPKKQAPDLYFFSHTLKWWSRFSDVANIEFHPCRSFASSDQKKLIPNNFIGKRIFKILFQLEDRYPNFFVRFFQYPIIVLIKK